MKFSLKDKPLSVQIWLILTLVLGLSFTLEAILVPMVLKISFTRETYARLVETQDYILKYEKGDLFKEKKIDKYDIKPSLKHPPYRVARHIFIDIEGNIIGDIPGDIKYEVIESFKNDISRQTEEIKNYSLEITQNKHIMYVIRKSTYNGKEGYLISYLWGAYRDSFVKMTFMRLIAILSFVLIINWIASIFLARYITRPLKKLQEKLKDIAARKWNRPVSLNRSDDIGKLGETVEWMRKQLLEYNEKQQSFLQQVSHELKTPIMVIRSYAESIHDGIFPKDTLENSVQVIEDETKRLEKRVRSLLDVTKFDYLSTHNPELSEFDIAKLIDNKIENFSWYRSDLKWAKDLKNITITADKEKISIALENIFDNQIRYAEKLVKIKQEIFYENNEEYIQIKVWNDGPLIDSEIINDIFNKYHKGSDGEFGLGLAIARIIVEMHNGHIRAANEDPGVAFYINIPIAYKS